jgi:hypothetical protein
MVSGVMVWVLSLVIGVISSLVAALVFLLAVSRWRPKIDISPTISKSARSDGAVVYNIKIINRTKRPIVGVQTRLTHATPRSVGKGPVYEHRSLKLKTSEVMWIPRFDANDADARYAIKVRNRRGLGD